jgi:allantoicase
MADQPVKAHFTEDVTLPDGRRIRVSAYPDGSIRFRVDGLPYVLTEAYLTGNPEKNQAIMKISPGRQGSSASHNYVEWLESKNHS